MTAYAAVVSLINTMKQIQSHPRLSFAFNDEQFEFLFEKLGFLLHHIKGNSRAAGPIWLLDLGSVLTTFDSPVKEVMEYEKEKGSINNYVELTRSADELIQQPMERLLSSNDVHQTTHSTIGFEEELNQQPMERLLRKNTMMIGFEEELNQLMEMLIGQESSRQIIPIVGMGGIGKTTLATSAFENQNSVDHFDVRAWATISQNYNVRVILLQLLSIKSKSIADTGTEEELGLKLHKRLCGRRYLIILDDLWSVEAWEKIRFFFPDNNNGSRVVVTTRLSNMATYVGSPCFAKKFLEEDQSWKLLQEKAFGQQGCPPELQEIGMEIAKKCKGLPLSVTVIGGFLGKSPMTKKYWEKIAKDINSILSSGEDDHEQCSNILSTSYTHLPAHLKPCFLYMGVYQEDEEIRVTKLIKLWVSEGFLEPNEAQTLEEIAEGYVNDLVDRNLIIASRWEVSGKIKTCYVHDVLMDLCLRISEKEKFIRVIPYFNFPQDIASDRRLVIPGGIPDPFDEDDRFYYGPEYFQCIEAMGSSSLARSLFTRKLGYELRLLRVLEMVDWPLIDQVNLRYLSILMGFTTVKYKKTETDDVLKMWNLQTFISTCNVDETAPLEIWKMQQLRHLEVEGLYICDPDEQHGGYILQNLQTLTGVVNLRLNAEVCRRIPNVRTLGILYYDYDFSGSSEEDALISKCTSKLTLEKCKIRWEDLTFIGCCPNLEVLKLARVWLIGSEWSPVEGQFLRLKILKIHARENRHPIRWNADCNHFPVLEKLVLGYLRALEEIPSGIGEIQTLRRISLSDPTDSAALSTVRILQDQLDNSGYEEIEVQVKFVDEEMLERFKELMTETENFTCKNVQLHVLEDTSFKYM